MEHARRGEPRAAYGTERLKRLSRDRLLRLGRGFSERNPEQVRQFYLQWQIPQTLSANSTAILAHDSSIHLRFRPADDKLKTERVASAGRS